MAVHTLRIDRWHPHRLKSVLAHHWGARSAKKKHDRDLVAFYALQARLPKASGRRRVSLVIVLGEKDRGGDPDAYWKSLLDALVACGQLVDDSRQWLELGTISYRKATTRATEIVLEDLADGDPSI